MPRLGKKGKVILTISGVAICLAIVVLLIISNKYSNRIKDELPRKVAKATDGLYSISVKRVHVNVFTRSVTFKDILIQADSTKINQQFSDSTAPTHYYSIRIPKLKVSQIMWDELVGGKGFSCSRFKLFDPKVSVWKNDTLVQKYRDTNREPPKRELSTSEFIVENGNIEYIPLNYDSSNKVLRFTGVNILLSNWKINQETFNDSSRFLFAKKGEIKVDTFMYVEPKLDYNFTIRSIIFNSAISNLSARDISLKLKMSEEQFYQKHKIQTEIYDIHFPTFEITDVNWQKLFKENVFAASTLYLNRSNISILFNRELLENNKSKLGKFPNQMLYKLKLPVYIENVRANDCNVTYAEISDHTGEKAAIEFSKISGHIQNITNIQSIVDSNNICIANLDAKLNKYTDVASVFKFVLNDPDGTFSMNVDIAGLQGHQINQQTKALTLIAVKSLNMKKLTMQLSGNERYTESKFIMRYNNLAIKVLKQDSDNKKQKRKKGLITFVANNLILFSNNPMPGENIRTVNTYVKRDANKSFFNQIWRNIHQGVQETTIRDIDMIDWFRSQEKAKKERNKKRLKEVFVPDEK